MFLFGRSSLAAPLDVQNRAANANPDPNLVPAGPVVAPIDSDGVIKAIPVPRGARIVRAIDRAFVKPLDKAAATVLRGYLHTKGFKVRKVKTDLSTMRVYEADGFGHLPPIVLVHGIGGRATDYYKMLGRLRYQYSKVIMPELPGHGGSKIRDRNAVINHATYTKSISQALNQVIDPKDPAIIFGHSLGGSFAVTYCRNHPERVQGLILASPTGAPFGKDLPRYRDLYSMLHYKDARTVTAKAFGKPHPLMALFVWARLSKRQSQKMVMSDMFTRPIQPDELSGLKMPVLLMWGKNDHLLPDSHIKYFSTHLPKGTVLTRPEGMSHNNPALGPASVRGPLAAFAKRVTGGLGMRRKK
jgi:pimeloyl-ACP methyl ester carboxylesterase